MNYQEKTARGYKKVASLLLIVTTFLSTLAYKFVFPWIAIKFAHEPVLGEVANFLINLGSIYGVLFVLLYLVYDKLLWKFLYRKTYFGGYWKGSITYTICLNEHDHKGKPTISLPFSFEVFIKIVHAPFKLTTEQGLSKDISERWHVSNVEITDCGELSYVYYAERTVEKDSPIQPKVEGKEVLTVSKYDQTGRPKKLRGKFYHIALHNTPLYSGECKYERISKEEYFKLTIGT